MRGVAPGVGRGLGRCRRTLPSIAGTARDVVWFAMRFVPLVVVTLLACATAPSPRTELPQQGAEGGEAAWAAIASAEALARTVRAAERERVMAAINEARRLAGRFERDPSDRHGEDLAGALEALVLASKVRREGLTPPDPDKRPDICQPTPVCPHRGGDRQHDRCADDEPPNAIPGCDVKVGGKSFDAITHDDALWEVKTAAYSHYRRSLKRLVFAAYVTEAGLEQAIAKACRFSFVFAVADDELYARMRDTLTGITIRHVPRCRRR